MTNELDIRDLFSEDEVDDRLDAEKELVRLSFRDAAVVYLYACGHTEAEIGERVGCSRPRISQILAKTYKSAEKLDVNHRQ